MPQYFKNDLVPIRINKESLQNILIEFQEAVRRGIELIKANSPPPDPNDSQAFGSIYNGDIGIALMAIRLARQAKYLETESMSPDALASEAHILASTRINSHLMKANLRPGKLSPLGSGSVGASIIRIIAASTNLPARDSGQCYRVHSHDVAVLTDAVRIACEQGDAGGGDDVLFGRAGLLHTVLNIREIRTDQKTEEALTPIYESIPKLVNYIIDSGKLGARDFVNEYREREALPLMWPWHDKYYVGAIHGICGVLAILLCCTPKELGEDSPDNHIPIISQTIDKLCGLCLSEDGHIPSSVPQRPSSRPSPLVQICHGAPGLLLLLSRARNNAHFASTYWDPSWDRAIHLSTQRVWEQGLLYKGGGLCHGIAGNAWPLLMCHDAFEYGAQGRSKDRQAFSERVSVLPQAQRLRGDYFLSRALAFLLQVRKTKPFNTYTFGDNIQYRMPDAPYSLFEGLAGTICAWAEACVVIYARLRKMDMEENPETGPFESDSTFRRDLLDELGMPGFATRGYL